MSKKMLINATHLEESRVAIVEDGVLTELDIEIAGSEQNKGNIYKATVVRVEPGLQAAFVDYGANRLGFLQLSEIHPSLYPEKDQDGGSRPRINDILKRGQELMVQIIREERGTKGAALTTHISLPGRYMVLMPDSNTKGISRKVEDEATRKKLKESMATLKIPDNMGYIVRTAGIGQKVTELRRDFKYLSGIWKKIQQLNRKEKAPAILYQESDIVIRSIREYFSPDMDEILIDDPEVYKEAQDFFKTIMPAQVKILKQHQERRPIFSRYQVEDQIETITSNKVPLPSGGSIVLDQTEALVAIDVNSGRMASEKGIEATAFKSNMEAAGEIGRQLRLRDLGGLVVIDFIDMRDRKNNREVEKALKNSLKNDKAKLTVGKISQFGLLEMSRQRLRPALAEGSYHPCPNCSGSGRVKSAEAQAVAVLRQLHTSCAKGKVEKAEVTVPTEVANYLLNVRREELVDMEKRLNLTISITGSADFTAERVEFEISRRDRSDDDKSDSGRSESPKEQKPHAEKDAGADANVDGDKRDGERKRRRPPRKKKPQNKPAGEARSGDDGKAGKTDRPTPEKTTPEDNKSETDNRKDKSQNDQSGSRSGENDQSNESPQRKRRPPRRKPAPRNPQEKRNDSDPRTGSSGSEQSGEGDKRSSPPPEDKVEKQPKEKRSFIESFMEPLLPKSGGDKNS